MKRSKTCDSCGVEWVYKTGVDIKDHWYEFNGMTFCGQCYAEGNADELAMEDFAKSLKENDSGHRPS